jgi:DNA repair exonuclease SbcCD ATPase subunit
MRILELEFRNFNSYGNGLQKLDLRDPNFYLLYGNSGVGKSTIREVIGYLIYGKVDGKNMGDLPNRTNKKDLFGRILVETNGSKIEICRGMKPNIFTVVIDGEPEDTAGKRNVQDILELEYFKIPQSTYNNVVTISIDKFKSFLNMSPGDKRKIIDQIFSFIVFNKVYEKLNRKVLDYNSDLKNINGKINVLTESKEDILKKIENINNTNKDKINETLKELTPKIQDLQQKSKKFEEALNKIKEKQDLIDSKQRTVNSDAIRIGHDVRILNSKISLYANDQCPECSGDLKDDFHQNRKSELEKELEDIILLKKEKEADLLKLQTAGKQVLDKKRQVTESLAKIKHNLMQLTSEYKLTKANGDKKPDEFNDILENTVAKLDELLVNLDEMSKEEFLYSEISKIFAEDGVKKQILKSVLPGLNKSINEFTKKLHFPYKIEIDDKFNSILTSVGEPISVKTLSTGEHKKADFAVLIAIIKIMKRNFPGINMLFLDELLGGIDGHGIYELLSLTRKIVDELEMNVFVINHSELPSEIFDYMIEVIKKSGFSEMHIEKT